MLRKYKRNKLASCKYLFYQKQCSTMVLIAFMQMHAIFRPSRKTALCKNKNFKSIFKLSILSIYLFNTPIIFSCSHVQEKCICSTSFYWVNVDRRSAGTDITCNCVVDTQLTYSWKWETIHPVALTWSTRDNLNKEITTTEGHTKLPGCNSNPSPY